MRSRFKGADAKVKEATIERCSRCHGVSLCPLLGGTPVWSAADTQQEQVRLREEEDLEPAGNGCSFRLTTCLLRSAELPRGLFLRLCAGASVRFVALAGSRVAFQL
jgi:hypothetical protein